jgi:hypothetical protein
MAISKYFTVTVKPTITASLQAGGTVAGGDILYDWTSFDMPKGGANLVGVTTLIRGTNGAAQEVGVDLYFAKDVGGIAPGSLGTLSATADGSNYQNHLIGAAHVNAADYKDGLDIMAVASSGHGGGVSQGMNMVLEGTQQGTNVGYDRLYLAAIAKGAFDFRSTVQVATETATDTTAVVVKTTSALTNFAAGDVIHDEDDLVIGTIKTVTDATNLVLEENCAAVSAVNKDLYNLTPVTFILSFER